MPGCRKHFLVFPALLFLWRCGYVGEPLPPALHIPVRVTDLAAVERGPKIIIQFTIPTRSTEGLEIRTPPEVDLRVGTPPVPFDSKRWAESASVVGVPSNSGRVRVEAPAGPFYGKEAIIGVRLINENGRDSGWSNLVALSIVPPPEKPSELKAADSEGGVLLTWKSQGSSFKIYRRPVPNGAWIMLADSGNSTYTDAQAESGKSYEYFIQGFGTAGKSTVESEPSETISWTPKDVSPPATPTGLMVVAGSNRIELVWDRNSEPDLAGYRIYRAVEGATLERIGETQEAPTFSDRNVAPGKVYHYAVSAVDKTGNESKLSQPVESLIP